jgi:hypothetical protein
VDLSSITDRVKSVPPVAWVVGAGVIILFLVLGRGKGGSTAGVVSGGTSGGGGGGGGQDIGGVPSDIGQQVVDLAGELRANTAADAAFQQTILDAVNNIKPPVPSPTPAGTGGGTGTGTAGGAVAPPTPAANPVARNPLWGNNIAPSIMKAFNPAALALAIRRAGPGTQSAKTAYGANINTEDIARALTRSGIRYGRIVDVADINKLLAKQGISKTAGAAKP